MSTILEPPPRDEGTNRHDALTYALNPAMVMSSGKTVGQVAHAAVMAAARCPECAAAGCPAQVIALRAAGR